MSYVTNYRITDVLEIIDDLDHCYSTDQSRPLYYQRLALMELSGWLEVTVDEIVRRYAATRLNNDNFKEIEIAIKKTHGAKYKNNIRNLLIQLVGLINVEKIENNLKNSGKSLNQLNSHSEAIMDERNRCAHTPISGVMQTFQTPSVYKVWLTDLGKALLDLEQELIKIEQT